MKNFILFFSLLCALVFQAQAANNFAKDQLVAWCIVPFDAAKRGPAARAEMLKRLGLKRVAYDWREQHVKEFEEEILQYKKHGLEFFAFWAVHEKAFALFEKHKMHPQTGAAMGFPPRVHNAFPSQYPRIPSYFSLIHQPVGSMDSFHVFASSSFGAPSAAEMDWQKTTVQMNNRGFMVGNLPQAASLVNGPIFLTPAHPESRARARR